MTLLTAERSDITGKNRLLVGVNKSSRLNDFLPRPDSDGLFMDESFGAKIVKVLSVVSVIRVIGRHRECSVFNVGQNDNDSAGILGPGRFPGYRTESPTPQKRPPNCG